MVASQFDAHSASSRFLIRPNCSLPWRGVVRFYMSMVVVSFGIATVFALQGAWLILPFAGLEMLVLGIALYLVARRGNDWQTVMVRGDSIEIMEHSGGNKKHCTLQRAWARVELKQAAINGHPSRLVVGSHGKSVEIGGCLNETEKKKLARDLGRAIAPAA